MEEVNNIYSRQLGIIPPEQLLFPISIIGAGSIGSWTALCLAKMGCLDIEIWDFDKVEPHNTPNQFFNRIDGGEEFKKNRLLADTISDFSHTIPKTQEGYTDEALSSKIIISAVDNMETRKKLFEKHKGTDKWLIDGRMGGNAIEVYVTKLDNDTQCNEYARTLFADAEALPVPCSHRSVAYNGLTIAGYISSVVAKIAMEESYPTEMAIDMLNYRVEISA